MKIDLKIGGETIPLYFGMVAFEEMQKLVSSYMGANKYATDVVWSGYLNECAINALYPEMTYGQLMVKMEENFFNSDEPDSNINDVLECFEKSKAGSKLFDVVDQALTIINGTRETLEEEVKKKVAKKPHIRSSKK